MKHERTRSGPPFWLLAALLMLTVLAWQLAVYHRQQQHKQLRDALGELQLAIERYAVDNEGSYPSDLARYVELHKVTLPRNPYGGGRIKILEPGEPWEPGGIVYVAFGPIVAKADGSPLAAGDIVPTDTDQYVLVAYSPRQHSRQPRVQIEADYEGKLEQIDWEHAALVLTAGAASVDPDRPAFGRR